MATGMTKLENLINPEVMADMIAAELKNKIKLKPIAQVDDTLVGQPGDELTVQNGSTSEMLKTSQRERQSLSPRWARLTQR